MPFRLKSRNYHVVAYNISILAEGLHFSALVIIIIIIIIIKHTKIRCKGKKKDREHQWSTGLYPVANRGLKGSWTDHWYTRIQPQE